MTGSAKEHGMRFESIKSIVLTLLVISSLFLTGQIWFNKKLWPEGYNFFVTMQSNVVENITSIFGGGSAAEPASDARLITPKHFVAYTVKDFDHAGLIMTPDYETYPELDSYIQSALSKSLAEPVASLVRQTEEDWQNALFTRGVYIEYPSTYPTETFAMLMGAVSCPIGDIVGSVRRFVIAPGDGFSNTVWVYIRDESGDGIYRIASGADKSDMERMLAALSKDASVQNRFSFFIGADTPTGNAGEVLFEPYLILCEEPQSRESIESLNPIAYDEGVEVSSYNMEKLLKKFSVNPFTAKRYTGAYGDIMFVQNNATLTISPRGIIDYSVLRGAKGVPLGDEAQDMSASAAMAAAHRFADELLDIAWASEGIELYCSGFSSEQGGYTISFDYMYKGTPIMFTNVEGVLPEAEAYADSAEVTQVEEPAQADSGTYTDGEEGERRQTDSGMIGSAVTIEIENGRIKRYTHIIRMYRSRGEKQSTLSSYQAVDTLYARLSDEERGRRIDDMIISYDDNGLNGIKPLHWFIRIEGYERYIR